MDTVLGLITTQKSFTMNPSSIRCSTDMSSRKWLIVKNTSNRGSVFTTLIYLLLTNGHKRLECLSLACLSSLVRCLKVKPEPTRAKHLLGALLWGRLRALLTNIRLGWKGIPGTNHLAYRTHSQINNYSFRINYDHKKFYNEASRGQCYKKKFKSRWQIFSG